MGTKWVLTSNHLASAHGQITSSKQGGCKTPEDLMFIEHPFSVPLQTHRTAKVTERKQVPFTGPGTEWHLSDTSLL